MTSQEHIKASLLHTSEWLDEHYTFDDAGRRMMIQLEPNEGPVITNQKTSFVYDAQGRRTKRIQSDRREERTSFDALGRMIKLERTSAVPAGCSGTACDCGV
ncbi:MAG: hypothetical protein U0V87_05185 [Acidobacteriota bacterium]